MASDTLTDGKEIDREEVVTRLNSFAALRVMSPADLRELANRIEPRTLEQDAMLQEMQASGDYLYLVESGALRETGKDSDGTVWWERTHTAGVIFSRQPDVDCSEDCSASVGECEFVVAGGQGPPLFEGVEIAFDDVPAFVVLFVETWRSSARGATSFPMADLIGRLRDDSDDAAVAQVGSDGPG